MKSILGRAVAAVAIVAGLTVGAVAPANAATGNETAAAEAVFTTVYNAPNPEAALAKLSKTDRALFDKWVTPVFKVESVTPTKSATTSATAARASCSQYTTRGSFSNQVGAKLGEFWTTGSACRSGSSVTSVSFVDGGGRTSALGWSYTGSSTGKGISRNTGYVYGQYKFKLQLGPVVAQEPSYCARTVHTLGADFGDTRCGLG
ncbi:hypothetical protein [Microbacterium sp. RURRCA19A]|uniref:hypothetical protein n=1 Tax=Microbacterium sp. RURRCA19A TaxID=1907391 RepID=UPI000956BFDE|nr:hypothetical protein [Microbacterium sp. RURRCA19A]SIS19991.1 hypothetical protein SAMN05880568_3498 [Microbacterium sp. RURRCA19A]